jgi:hypothetical protein
MEKKHSARRPALFLTASEADFARISTVGFEEGHMTFSGASAFTCAITAGQGTVLISHQSFTVPIIPQRAEDHHGVARPASGKQEGD